MPELNVTNGWQVRNAEYDLLSGGYPLSQAIPATAERDAGDVVYASLVCVTIAKGRIKDIDASAAFRINGVVSILTHQNLPHMTEDQFDEEGTIPPGSSVTAWPASRIPGVPANGVVVPRSRAVTSDAVASGRWANSSAAAAATIGDANDVPSKLV